jgi:hypothetical protein
VPSVFLGDLRFEGLQVSVHRLHHVGLPIEVPRSIGADALSALFKPLSFLLVEGGDSRLAVDPATKANVYGCRSHPTPGTLAFSSSTATSISERAYRRAECARNELIEESIALDVLEAFDRRVERMRHSLRSCLELDGAEIVFSPSGTDTQLHALFFARQLLGGPVTSIVMASDQTGSGTVYTSRGQNFSNRTAQGKSVEKGTPIDGLADDVDSLGVSMFAPDGAIRSASEIDAAVIEAVAGQIRLGRKVVLQTMDSSKLGWRAPSDGCLRYTCARWPHAVQIVVDACQMRIGRPRLRDYLDRGYIVLVTGSKFFTGPAFSGASLFGAALADRAAAWTALPDGLAQYATRYDLPLRWLSARAALPAAPNFGQWLRWEAALEEMRAYYALPESTRRSALMRLAEAIPVLIASSEHLELMAGQGVLADALDDEEMSCRTIFPFFVKRGGRTLDLDEMTKIYHALNRDFSAALPDMDAERALASVPCHIGQPVKLPAAGGAVLRIGIGARLLSQAWSADARTVEENIGAVIDRVDTVVRKIDLIVRTGIHNPVERRTMAV